MIKQVDKISFVVGENQEMKNLFNSLQRIASSDCSVLITGETGVGKEIVAQLIHWLSPRKSAEFVGVNCAALAPQLIESELFGHEKGAFTSAEMTRLGRFEFADKGTILLDEISELDLRLQSKLLRVLETKSFERVGSSYSKTADVRIIATSNIDIPSLVKANKFRADLYYRLNVIPVNIPPLRKRREEIEELLNHFITKHCHKQKISLKSFSADAVRLLSDYTWPGNVRELSNFVERAVVLSSGPVITPEDIGQWICDGMTANVEISSQLVGLKMDEIERAAILSNLRHCGGDRSRTAGILNMSERTLRYKLKQFNINNDERETEKEKTL